MKKILSFVCLAWSVAANAQFTPGQILTAAELNNQFSLYAPLSGAAFIGGVSGPSFSGAFSGPLNGSVGATSPSTGVFTNLTATGTVTVPSGTVALSGLAAQAANTVVANATGSSASPTAIAVPSCSTSSSALNWTTSGGAGALTCNTAINAFSLGGTAAASYALLASPTFTGTPAAPTAATGTATTQLATTAFVTTSPTLNQPTINAVTGATDAGTGVLGQYVTSTYTSIAQVTNSINNFTSVSLTAGVWDVECNTTFLGSGSTTWTAAVNWISTTSVTLPAVPNYSPDTLTFSAVTAPSFNMVAPKQHLLLASTTTVYCSGFATFSAGSITANGTLRAIRTH